MPDSPESVAETRRNLGADSFVRIWPSDEWIILHVRSGGVETTTSLRAHDAYPLALALSPDLNREHDERRRKVSDLQQALYQFQWCDTANAQLLRRIADEWDCSGSCDKFHTEWDTGATVCSEEERDGCRALEAESLRDLAKAIETRAALLDRAPSGVAADTLAPDAPEGTA